MSLKLNILVIGSGGREHALAWKLAQSQNCQQVWVGPGNAGMSLDESFQVLGGSYSFEQALTWARDLKPDLVVIGPEDPLVEGLADRLVELDIPVLGPSAAAAKLEGSKVFAKNFMQRWQIPTADFASFRDAAAAKAALRTWCQANGVVIKCDQLAAGKGVVVADDGTQAEQAIFDMMENESYPIHAQEILLEQRLRGREVSAFALCDGEHFVSLGYACDYKRAYDGDRGPNTGGMGCYTPTEWPDSKLRADIEERVFRPVLAGMRAEGTPFKGILFAGIMLVQDQASQKEIPYVIEFNVRFGDPETQTLLPALKLDLAELFYQAATGKLQGTSAPSSLPQASVHVVLASENYPGVSGVPIRLGQTIAIDQVKLKNLHDCKLFFAGVKQQGATLVNSGGRVMGITALGRDLSEARARVYEAISCLQFEGAFFRRDIALIKNNQDQKS